MNMNGQKIHIVFNPASAGGKTGRKREKILSELKYHLGSTFSFSETAEPKDATTITRKVITNGCDTVIVVGGDGTVNQVLNGFFNNGISINSDIKLGIISCGTGQGFSQSLGLPSDLSSQINVIRENRIKSVDVGKITFEDNNIPKYFLNEFQFGIGGNLNKTISPKTKRVLRKFAFGFEAVKTLFKYQADELQIVLNGRTISEKIIGVVIANGAYTGGGMRLTPNALLNDGLFDVLVIKDMPIKNRLVSFSKVYSAKHLDLEAFQLIKSKKIEFCYKNGFAVESDGELIYDKCVCVEVLPSVLKVISNN
jgi:YegS/Rv2252/BmrU family lipid kinase